MVNLKYSVGIDVSKKDFHCCLSAIDTEQCVKVKVSHKFSNSKPGFKLFMDWLRRNLKEQLPVFCVMEATGVYHEQLAWFLEGQAIAVSILLPNKAKRYLQANGAKSKNDKIDARGLSQIGAKKNWNYGCRQPGSSMSSGVIHASIRASANSIPPWATSLRR